MTHLFIPPTHHTHTRPSAFYSNRICYPPGRKEERRTSFLHEADRKYQKFNSRNWHEKSPCLLPDKVRKQLIKMENERLRNLESQRSAAFMSFSDTEEDLVLKVLQRGQDEDDVLAHFYGNTVTRAQIRCLEGKNWLTSTVIDYIFSVWNERSNIVDSKHVFICTYFMDRLRDGGRYNFSNVRDWFNKGRDIEDDSIMYIPVNIYNRRWTLLVIDMRRKSLKYYDGLRGKLIHILFILHTMKD
jgi:Ulp1 family protease